MNLYILGERLNTEFAGGSWGSGAVAQRSTTLIWNTEREEAHPRIRSIKVGNSGAVAQLGERLVRNEEVVGSIPISSTVEAGDEYHARYCEAGPIDGHLFSPGM